MPLATMQWTRVSVHAVVLAWLRAERGRLGELLSATPEMIWLSGLRALLDQAHLDNAEENRARLRLLYMIRNLFMIEIPPDTEWYKVQNLTDNEVDELRAINSSDWVSPADKNELRRVAGRKTLTLDAAPSSWETPILWSHDRNGPFTILEGNNRLTAYTASGQHGLLNIPVFVGLSPLACIWHILDNCRPLMQDLFAR